MQGRGRAILIKRSSSKYLSLFGLLFTRLFTPKRMLKTLLAKQHNGSLRIHGRIPTMPRMRQTCPSFCKDFRNSKKRSYFRLSCTGLDFPIKETHDAERSFAMCTLCLRCLSYALLYTYCWFSKPEGSSNFAGSAIVVFRGIRRGLEKSRCYDWMDCREQSR